MQSVTSSRTVGVPFAKTTSITAPKKPIIAWNFFKVTDLLLFNWQDQCTIDSYAFHSNPDSKYASLTDFKNLIVDHIIEDNFLRYLGTDHNALTRVSSFVAATSTQNNSNIIVNTKWNGAIKKYLVPVTPPALPPSVTNEQQIISDILPNFSLLTNCKKMNEWNATLCAKDRPFGMIHFSSVSDIDMSPVHIINVADNFDNEVKTSIGFNDLVGLIEMGKDYKLSFPGHPYDTSFEVLSFPTTSPLGGVNTLKYGSPQSVIVYKDGTEVAPTTQNQNSPTPLTTCGANSWTMVTNTLQFYLSNEINCKLEIVIIESIQLSLRLASSVDEFFSNPSYQNDLIYNIAATLGIPPHQIKITNVSTGSVILLLHILQTDPKIKTPNASHKKLDLNQAVTTLVKDINSGKLTFYAPPIDLKYQITTKPKPVNQGSTTPTAPTTAYTNSTATTGTTNNNNNTQQSKPTIKVINFDETNKDYFKNFNYQLYHEKYGGSAKTSTKDPTSSIIKGIPTLTVGQKAGIGVGVSVFILLIIGAIVLIWYKCCRKAQGEERSSTLKTLETQSPSIHPTRRNTEDKSLPMPDSPVSPARKITGLGENNEQDFKIIAFNLDHDSHKDDGFSSGKGSEGCKASDFNSEKILQMKINRRTESHEYMMHGQLEFNLKGGERLQDDKFKTGPLDFLPTIEEPVETPKLITIRTTDHLMTERPDDIPEIECDDISGFSIEEIESKKSKKV
ncbi:MAG: hypothetical protein GY861_05925 [bacterium]|nr:hypothetical protein [bacterium]